MADARRAQASAAVDAGNEKVWMQMAELTQSIRGFITLTSAHAHAAAGRIWNSSNVVVMAYDQNLTQCSAYASLKPEQSYLTRPIRPTSWNADALFGMT